MCAGEVAAFLDVDVEVAGAVENERRAGDARQQLPHVGLRVHEDEVAGTRRAEPRAAASLEPGAERGVGIRRHGREVHVLAPRALELGRHVRSLLARRRPGIVVVGVAALRVRPVEHEGARPLRVARREEHAERAAFRVAEERRRLASGRVHDGAHVVHARLEVGEADAPVGEPRPPLVEADQPGERPEALEEVSVRRALPVDLEVGEEALHEHEVERAVARHLVGDVDVPAARVPDLRAHRREA